jgi:hypothetical protein
MQFARPSSQVSRGSWTTNTGSTTNLWSAIDDAVADDTDYVISAIGANDSCEFGLSSVAPAVIPRDHSVVIRGRKDATGGNDKGVDVTLLQGATVLGTQSFPILPVAATQQIIGLPRSMVSGITDYAGLRLRLTSTGLTTGGSARRRSVITGAALMVPSASDLVDDLLVRWGVSVDSSGVTVQVSKSGFVGTGPTLAWAIWSLFDAMRQDPTFYAANAAEIERRFAIAYGLWKVIEYQRIRDDIVAGTYPLPSHQNQAQGIAICDQKIARFIANAQANDAGDGA